MHSGILVQDHFEGLCRNRNFWRYIHLCPQMRQKTMIFFPVLNDAEIYDVATGKVILGERRGKTDHQ